MPAVTEPLRVLYVRCPRCNGLQDAHHRGDLRADVIYEQWCQSCGPHHEITWTAEGHGFYQGETDDETCPRCGHVHAAPRSRLLRWAVCPACALHFTPARFRAPRGEA